jgi:hypothetical protein
MTQKLQVSLQVRLGLGPAVGRLACFGPQKVALKWVFEAAYWGLGWSCSHEVTY